MPTPRRAPTSPRPLRARLGTRLLRGGLAALLDAKTADYSGTPHQDRLFYAVNSARWWLVSIDANRTDTLRLAHSTDAVSWTDAGQIVLQSNLESLLGNNKWPRNVAVAYKSISSTDVVYIWTAYAAATTSHSLWAQRLTLSGGTFTVTNAEAQVGTTITGSNNHATMGVAGAISTDNFAWSVGGYETTGYGSWRVQRATNADAGSSWTAGWNLSGTIGTAHTQISDSQTIFPVGANKMVAVMDEGSTTGLTDDILQWSASPSGGGVSNWTAGGTPPDYSQAGGHAADTTADFDLDDWAACRVSDTDVHVVVRDPDTANAFVHRRWNGTSWSAGQSIPTQATKAGAGLLLASNGTDAWLLIVDSDAANTVRWIKWTASGPSWGTWTALESSTQTRTGLAGYRTVANSTVGVLWTEATATGFRLVTKPLTVSGGPQTIPVGQATETETAQAVTVLKTVQVAQAVETETAQAVGRLKTLATGQATETETAQAVGKAKVKALAQATETETSQAITTRKTVTVAQATETETAQTATVRGAVGQATETETAQAVGRLKARAAAQATETESAQAITVRKTVAVGQAVETESAQAIGRQKVKVAAQAVETETAQAVARVKVKAVAQVVETESAQTIQPTGPKIIAVGQAVETETAQAVTRVKVKALGQATETETAQAVSRRKTAAVAQAVETETAQAVTIPPPVPPPRWMEGGGALAALIEGAITAGPLGSAYSDTYSNSYQPAGGPVEGALVGVGMVEGGAGV